MRSKLLVLFLFLSISCFPQGEASNWFFGNRAGIRFNSDNTITTLSTFPNPIRIVTDEGCSSFSDLNGNLLLYTDGRTVWDRNHVIMPNGDYAAGTGLFGDPSSTQSGIIIPNPANPNLYYIFTVDEPHHQNAAAYPNQFSGVYEAGGGTIPDGDDGFNNGLNYSVVDMSLTGANGSIGNVTTRNVHLVTYNPDPAGEEIKYKCSEKITAVQIRNGGGYWVITHFIDKFYAFKIDPSGVSTTPVISQLNPVVPISGYRRNAIGQIKVSPNGKKIAVAHVQITETHVGPQTGGALYLYDFDNSTGIVSNGQAIVTDASCYGVEFSAETKKLYLSAENGVMQFNLEAASIPNSGQFISRKSFSALQLGPDKKIYKANINTGFEDAFLDVINNPEEDGIACNYQNAAISLDQGISRFGLPPFITSVFSTNILAKNLCAGQATEFEVSANGFVQSVVWDFGDGSAFSTVSEPSHVFPGPGNYTVWATAVVEGRTIRSSKNIQINPLPTAFPSSLTQCSPTAADTNILFKLSEASQNITGGNTNLSVSFFLSSQAANDNANPLPNSYPNISNPQRVFARVTDNTTGCFVTTTLDLTVNAVINTPLLFEKCDELNGEDGISDFTLTDVVIPGISPTATTSYYASIDDALLEQNALPTAYRNTVRDRQTIYARIEENNECDGLFPIHLVVNPLPQLRTEDTDYVCTNLPNRYITLNPGLLQGSISDYTYEWSTTPIQTTPTIRVNQVGTYTVKVTTAKGCSKTRTITVLPSNNATIANVVIVDLVQNNTVTVLLSPESIGSYQYSLDLPNGPFQDSNHFENVSPGFHTVYVYDTRGCGIVKKDISVLYIPNYFTPNGDGYNDTWNIIGINSVFYSNAKIYIFDRFGKLLADVDPKGAGWDGNYNNHPALSTDYWYLVLLNPERTVRGHFSLKR